MQSPDYSRANMMHIDRRTFLAAVGGMTGLFALSSGSFALAAAGPALRIGIGPEWGTSVHAVLAYKNGYFTDVGLDNVELETFPAGLVQLEALSAGALNVSNPAQAPVFGLRNAGVPVVILSGLATYGDTYWLVVNKALGVTQPKELYGLKIGLLRGTTAEHTLRNIVRHYDLDLDRIELVHLKPPEQLSALATGAVDGICVWQPWGYQATQRVQVDLLHTGLTSHFPHNNGETIKANATHSVLVVTEETIRKHPDTIDALVEAYYRAQQFIEDEGNFEEITRILSEFHDQDPEVNAQLFSQYRSVLALDEGFLDDMNEVQNFLVEVGRLPQPLSVEEITYGDPLRRVAPDKVTIDTRWQP